MLTNEHSNKGKRERFLMSRQNLVEEVVSKVMVGIYRTRDPRWVQTFSRESKTR